MAPPTTIEDQYLTFFIHRVEFALPILRVREVAACDTPTRIPSMPPAIRGVTPLRGGVIPVVDLAIKFGFPQTAIDRFTCVVVAEVSLDGEPTPIGVLVDAVGQAITLAPEEIVPPPPFGTSIRVDFLKGMGRLNQQFVQLLDLERLLSLDELLALDEVATGAAANKSAAPNVTLPEAAAMPTGGGRS